MSKLDFALEHWKNKASVRNWYPEFVTDDRPDYPLELLPDFTTPDQEKFEALRESIATGLWLNYNWRTIQAEEHIALPAIRFLTSQEGVRTEVKRGLLQTATDEQYHTYFHTLAIDDALQRYNRAFSPALSVTIRSMRTLLQDEQDAFKRELLVVAYAAVAEVSINAFLETLSRCHTIKESNRALVEQHNRDEAIHSLIFIEATLDLLRTLPAQHASFLDTAISDARDSFLLHDFSMYETIFAAHGVRATFSTASTCMSRDMRGVDKLLKTLRT
ncbi:diiron oxygenase [Pseudomonas piscis]|uniref:diiron oxygenase n=1 Tax=Pseudomonas piscis TaxID=2614538 RepID=UPI0003B4B2E4|nr:diiron oxygenase [Pseudomonas piscis]ERO59973.1 hypothetical protein P308_15815 [Pseudomonas piscis]